MYPEFGFLLTEQQEIQNILFVPIMFSNLGMIPHNLLKEMPTLGIPEHLYIICKNQ